MQDKNWFTVEPIDKDTFAISEWKHWEETHCYLLCGSDRALLIDTGLGVSDIKQVVDSLTSLPIQVVTTHVHWDHIGGHAHFRDIAVHESEEQWLDGHFPLPLQAVKNALTCRPCVFPEGFRPEEYRIFQGKPAGLLHDGDQIDLGNRTLIVLHTPGHSPGHCCFYEPARKTLYTGDLIYAGCLDAFYPTTDPLLFRQSVRRLLPLEVERLLPAHHRFPADPGLIARVDRAFSELADKGCLKQGSGLFDFGEFQIHV